MRGATRRRRCWPGTLVTIVGFLPVGFARSTAGEYAGNIFWVVGIRPDRFVDRRGGFHAVPWGQDAASDQTGRRRSPAIYDTTNYRRLSTAHHLRRSPQVRNRRHRCRRFRALRRRYGRRQTAILPDIRPSRSAGGGPACPRAPALRRRPPRSRSSNTGWSTSRRPRSSRAMSVRALPASSSQWRRSCLIRPSPRSSCRRRMQRRARL